MGKIGNIINLYYIHVCLHMYIKSLVWESDGGNGVGDRSGPLVGVAYTINEFRELCVTWQLAS